MPTRRKQTQKPVLLLLGYRKGAYEACLKLGFDVVIWDDTFITKRVKAAVPEYMIKSFNPTPQVYKHIKRQLKNWHFSAIIACKERAVVLAGRLRAVFHLPGVNLETAINCSDKYQMKRLAIEHGLPITPFRLLKQNSKLERIAKEYGYPFVTKPRNSSGRRGFVIIEHHQNRLSKGHLAEKWIEAPECSVESFIVNGQIQFVNITDYYEKTVSNIVPAQFEKREIARICQLNKKIIAAFEIPCGITHVELYRTQEGLLFGEIAVRPPGGYLMELISHSYQVDAWQLYIQSELNLPFKQKITKNPSISACWISHPGAGEVSSIEGVEEVKHLPTVLECRLSVSEGDKISERMGVGEDVGRIIFQSQSYQSLLRDIQFTARHLAIRLSN